MWGCRWPPPSQAARGDRHLRTADGACWLQPTAIVVLAVAGIGFIAAAGSWAAPLGFCFYAVVAAAPAA
jgi:hypothetical protein